MLSSFTKQYTLWLLALSFFTRIPVRIRTEINDDMLHQSSRYFALVGALIGVVLASFFYLFQWFFPAEITVILIMALNLLLTGAFHEDGWADTWDGFGGGWQVSQKLAIMKDSRLGTYGAAALILALLLKYQSLITLAPNLLVIISVLVIANTFSRANATSLILSLAYVSDDATSKAKPIVKQLSLINVAVLLLTCIIISFIVIGFTAITLLHLLIVFSVLVVVRQLLIYWFQQQLKGYTGDCLGAAQIVSELVIYLTFITLGVVSLA